MIRDGITSGTEPGSFTATITDQNAVSSVTATGKRGGA
jgi:hypothetical protein